MSIPLLSIVIGTRNRPNDFFRFIKSVEQTVDPKFIPYEVVVGDANDTDPRITYSTSAAVVNHRIRVIYQRPRQGMIKDYNECFRACRGEWVVWFNDDVVCLKGWADNALRYMQEHPEVGVGAIYFLDHSQRKVVSDVTLSAEETASLPPAEKYKNGWNTQFCIQSLWHLYYANFGILRRSLGDQLGWFDEVSGAMYGASDTHLCFSAIAAGYAVVGIPSSRVLHFRTHDEERLKNLERRFDDREKFDNMWQGRAEELREKHSKYDHLQPPKEID